MRAIGIFFDKIRSESFTREANTNVIFSRDLFSMKYETYQKHDTIFILLREFDLISLHSLGICHGAKYARKTKYNALGYKIKVSFSMYTIFHKPISLEPKKFFSEEYLDKHSDLPKTSICSFYRYSST